MSEPLNVPEAPAAAVATPPLPADAVIIVPVRETVLFPEIVLPVTLSSPEAIAAAQQAVRAQRQFAIVLQLPQGFERHVRVDRIGSIPREQAEVVYFASFACAWSLVAGDIHSSSSMPALNAASRFRMSASILALASALKCRSI